MLFPQRDQIGNRRAVPIHAENALAHDEFLRRAGIFPAKFPLQKIQIEMRENHLSRSGETQAIDNAGVIGGIGENRVAWLDESA